MSTRLDSTAADSPPSGDDGGYGRPGMATAETGSVHPEEQRERQQAQPEGEKGQMDQFDDAHVARRAGQCRGRRRFGQVRSLTVLVVVPVVVQSHRASVAQAPRRACPTVT